MVKFCRILTHCSWVTCSSRSVADRWRPIGVSDTVHLTFWPEAAGAAPKMADAVDHLFVAAWVNQSLRTWFHHLYTLLARTASRRRRRPVSTRRGKWNGQVSPENVFSKKTTLGFTSDSSSTARYLKRLMHFSRIQWSGKQSTNERENGPGKCDDMTSIISLETLSGRNKRIELGHD